LEGYAPGNEQGDKSIDENEEANKHAAKIIELRISVSSGKDLFKIQYSLSENVGMFKCENV
jgi:hypothetical protein